jgi:hypothetical protein
MKPLTLTNDHGRCIAVTPAKYMAVKFLAVSIPKTCNGRFASETTVRQFQKLNRHLDPELAFKIRWGF